MDARSRTEGSAKKRNGGLKQQHRGLRMIEGFAKKQSRGLRMNEGFAKKQDRGLQK